MGPVGHGLLSAGIGGAVWLGTHSVSAVPVAVGVGVLMDVDHVLDYYRWYVRKRRDKVFFLLHAWEYLALFLLIAALFNWSPLLIAALAAYFGHLVTDQVYYRAFPLGYFLSFRIIKGFHAQEVAPWDLSSAYKALTQGVPFGTLLERRLFRRK